MNFVQTALPGVVLIEPNVFEDDRGWFMESFNERRFADGLFQLGLPIPKPFVQDNQSCSKKGALRGLHYQLEPFAQGKLVSVTQGAAFDVAVDIREGSPTFGQWIGVELSASNKKMLWIPEGFAHGFVALEDNTHFHYKTTNFYNKNAERSVLWNDATLAIKWPALEEYLVSDKDQIAPRLEQAELPSWLAEPTDEVRTLNVIGDERGSLVALTRGLAVPFTIKRVYYLFGTQENISRGFHAHKQLDQMAVCISGRCRMMLDDGTSKKNIWLDRPDKGVLIKSKIWHEMHEFSADCVMMVLASDEYDESDYIRNYESFMSWVSKDAE